MTTTSTSLPSSGSRATAGTAAAGPAPAGSAAAGLAAAGPAPAGSAAAWFAAAGPASAAADRSEPLEGTEARILVTDRGDGDLAAARPGAAGHRAPGDASGDRPASGDGSGRGTGGDTEARTAPGGGGSDALRLLVPHRTWILPRQVHGARVLVLDGSQLPGDPAELEADGLVTADASLGLAVLGADCGLVGLASHEGGVFAVAHAGWRGLVAGVVGETVSAMRAEGASAVVARIGPCIHSCCYAFGAAHLEEVLAASPAAVAGTTTRGEPALDLPASLRRALELAGAEVQARIGGCTGCSQRWYSHRARGEEGRHALAVWRRAAAA